MAIKGLEATQIPPSCHKDHTTQQRQASPDEIGRVEAAEAVRPVPSGEYADTDTQIPRGLVGGGCHTPSFGRSHPDEQRVEGRMQRTE